MRDASSVSRASDCSPPKYAGAVGTQASIMRSFASALSPIKRMACAEGPMSVTPAAAQASTSAGSSERKP